MIQILLRCIRLGPNLLGRQSAGYLHSIDRQAAHLNGELGLVDALIQMTQVTRHHSVLGEIP